MPSRPDILEASGREGPFPRPESTLELFGLYEEVHGAFSAQTVARVGAALRRALMPPCGAAAQPAVERMSPLGTVRGSGVKTADRGIEVTAQGWTSPEDLVMEHCDSGNSGAVVAFLAERLRLAPGLVDRALRHSSHHSLTILCRGGGLSMNAYSALLRFRRRHVAAGEPQPSPALLHHYLKLPPEIAVEAVAWLRSALAADEEDRPLD